MEQAEIMRSRWQDFEELFNISLPTNKTILSWVSKFRGSGAATNSNEGKFGRWRRTKSNQHKGRVFDNVWKHK